MRVDQPRQHGRIGVVDQLTIGGGSYPIGSTPTMRPSSMSTVPPPALKFSPSKAWAAQTASTPHGYPTHWRLSTRFHVRHHDEASELRL
jgi:hypothetical protein